MQFLLWSCFLFAVRNIKLVFPRETEIQLNLPKVPVRYKESAVPRHNFPIEACWIVNVGSWSFITDGVLLKAFYLKAFIYLKSVFWALLGTSRVLQSQIMLDPAPDKTLTVLHILGGDRKRGKYRLSASTTVLWFGRAKSHKISDLTNNNQITNKK